jgi:hypothetical protein
MDWLERCLAILRDSLTEGASGQAVGWSVGLAQTRSHASRDCEKEDGPVRMTALPIHPFTHPAPRWQHARTRASSYVSPVFSHPCHVLHVAEHASRNSPPTIYAIMSTNGESPAPEPAGDSRDPSGFLSEIIGAPVTVKLNSGIIYKGACAAALCSPRLLT